MSMTARKTNVYELLTEEVEIILSEHYGEKLTIDVTTCPSEYRAKFSNGNSLDEGEIDDIVSTRFGESVYGLWNGINGEFVFIAYKED